MASKDIQIKGSFDASQILASFRKIRDEAAKSNVSDKLLGGYDKELEKVEKLTTQILAAQSRGLTDNLSIKEFARLVSQLEKQYGILNVKAQAFTDAANYKTETALIKQYSTLLKTLIDRLKSLEKSARDYIDANSDALKLSKEESKALKLSISDALAYKDVLDEIVEKRIEATKLKVTKLSLDATGGQLKYTDITSQSRDFTVSAAARKANDPSRQSAVNKKGLFNENFALLKANEEYNRILEKTIKEGNDAETAILELTKVMKAYRVELGDTDEIQERFANDIKEIRDAALADYSNLSGSAKGKFTLANNNLNRIRNNALDLYNNKDAGKAQLVAKEAIDTADKIAAAQNRNALATKDAIERQRLLGNAAGKAAKELVDGYKNVEKEATKYVSILDSIKNSFEAIGRGAKQILSVTTAWRSLRNVVKSTFNDVKALDKSFASIAMVTEYSVKDMWLQYDQYAEMANRLGQSTQSVVEASGLYYQQGLKTNEVLKLTEETMKLATLAGLDFKEATSQMTAALRAFHMDMSEGAHVTDVYAEVAAHAAVDVQGLSEAMSATAAIAHSAGMSFENTTAMLATMVEATQEAPKNLGTAMKTILARFTELKTNVAGTVDSEFDDLDYNKVDKALKSVGVSLKDAAGQFRNMDDVLLELSGKWKSLDRNSLRYIATIAAGSRQQSRFIALMENYERTMELVDVALNSAGRSSQQFAKYLDTVEYRVNKIKNSWEQFRTSLLDSDAYKGALDLFGGFLDKLKNMSGTGLAALATTWLTAGRSMFSNAFLGYGNLANSAFTITKEKFIDNFVQQKRMENPEYENYKSGKTTDEYIKELYKDEIDREFLLAEKRAQVKSKALGSIIATALATSITTGLTIDNPVAAGLTASATSAMSLLPTFILIGKTFGAGTGIGIGAAVTVAIGAISAGLSLWRKHELEEYEKTAEYLVQALKDKLEKLESSREEHRSNVKNILEEEQSLKDLTDEYSQLEKKVLLTQEEEARKLEIVNEITTNHSELVATYDELTGKLKLLTDELKKLLEVLKEKKEIEAQQTYQDSLSISSTETRIKDKELQNEFEKALKNKGYATNDLYLSGEELYKQFKENDFDVETTVKLIEERGGNDAAKDKVIETLKSFKGQFKKWEISFEKQYEAAKELVDITDDLSSELEKSIKAGFMAENTAANEEASLKARELADKAKNEDSVASVVNALGDLGKKLDKDQLTKTVNDAITGYNTRDNYSDLDDKTKKDLEKYLGIANAKQWEEYTAGGAMTDKDFSRKFLDAVISKTVAGEGKNLSTDQLKNIDLMTKEILNLLDRKDKLTNTEYLKTYDEIIDKWKVKLTNVEDLINNHIFPEKKTAEEIKLQLSSLGIGEMFDGIDSDTFDAFNKLLSDLKNNLGNFVDPKQLGESFKKYVDYINNSNLPKDITNALINLDFSQIDGKTELQAEEYLTKIFSDSEEIGEDAAKEYAKGLLNEIKNGDLADFNIKDVLGLDTRAEEIANSGKKIATAYKDVLSEVNNSLKNGKIDIFKKEELEKNIKDMGLDPSKYFYSQENGSYGVYYKDLQNDALALFKTDELITEELNALIDASIELLEADKAALLTLYSKSGELSELLNILQLITKEIGNQISLTTGKNINSYLSSHNIKLIDTTLSEQDKSEIQNRIRDILETIDKLNAKKTDKNYILKYINDYRAYENVVVSGGVEIDKTIEDIQKQQEKTNKDWIDKTKAVTDAQKSLAKAIETVAEKQKELKAVIEGTNWKSSVDGMYNYNTALDFLTKQTERAKKNFDKVSSISEAKNNFQIYGQSLLDLKAQLTAQNLTYRTAYKNIGKVYNNDVAKLIKSFEDSGQMKFNLADYLVFDEKTGTKINMNALQKAKMPEALKKWIETQGQKANEYLSKILDNEDKIDLINEEFLEQLRKARDEYISLQDLMIDVLREKYQQEIDDLQNKYDAMNEADNKYLESLQKNLDRQRKLRDLEKNWNDLTNKERKLSLMLRDTAGGNLADVKNLLNEIEDLRTLLLDDAVDLIIEKLTEFYELLKETRDAEIEYKLTLIDDVALLKEATEALEKILTSDDLVNWWKENVTGIEAFSEQKLGKLTEDWNKLFDAKSNYVASIDDKMKKSIEDANGHLKEVGDLAEEIVRTTSEGITNLAEQSLQEAGEEYKKAVKTAKDALLDAIDAVAKLKEALLAAIEAANESKKAFDEITAKYKEVLAEKEKLNLPKTVTIFVNKDGKYLDEGQNSSYRTGNLGKNPGNYQAQTITEGELLYKKQTGQLKQEDGKDTLELYISKQDGKKRALTTSEYNSYISENKGVNSGQYNKEFIKVPRGVKHGVLQLAKDGTTWEFINGSSTDTIEKAEEYITKHAPYVNGPSDISKATEYYKKRRAFAEGGLVNYTGPAWVDGSRSRPEAFLSSEDTRRIGEAARILADLPILSQPIKEQVPTTTIGDTTIQIDVHVDSIANDYDLDEAMNKVEQRIVNAAKYAGSNVILKKH